MRLRRGMAPGSEGATRRGRSHARASVFVALASLVAVLGTALAGLAAAPAAGAATNWAPVNSTDFPDPSVLYVPAGGGQPAIYYAFATQNTTFAGTTVNIQEATSPDGINWTASGTDAPARRTPGRVGARPARGRHRGRRGRAG